jgi:hypothetical protein
MFSWVVHSGHGSVIEITYHTLRASIYPGEWLGIRLTVDLKNDPTKQKERR